jgi:hypothetical protein
MQSVKCGQEQSTDVRRLNAALSAEESVKEALNNIGFHETFLRRRIFVAESNCNREIDVIAIIDKIYVIEVKNWSGSVWCNGPRWFQLPVKAERALEFGDITEECHFKAMSLLRHLENVHKILLPPGSVVSCVVFTSPAVKLDPNSAKRLPNVFTLESFREFIGKSRSGSSWRDLLAPVVPSFFHPSRSITLEQKNSVAHALGNVRTWDIVMLHNGTTIHGDLVSLECPNFYFSYDRKHIVSVIFKWASPSLVGLAVSLWKGSAGTVLVKLTEAKRVPKRNESKPRNDDGDMYFPILMDKRKGDWNTTDRLIFKRAGTAYSAPIRLTDVRSVELSEHTVK